MFRVKTFTQIASYAELSEVIFKSERAEGLFEKSFVYLPLILQLTDSKGYTGIDEEKKAIQNDGRMGSLPVPPVVCSVQRTRQEGS